MIRPYAVGTVVVPRIPRDGEESVGPGFVSEMRPFTNRVTTIDRINVPSFDPFHPTYRLANNAFAWDHRWLVPIFPRLPL